MAGPRRGLYGERQRCVVSRAFLGRSDGPMVSAGPAPPADRHIKRCSTEVPKYRSTEVPKYRSTEVPKYRSTEAPKYRDAGTARSAR
ncbi:hypothetical protein DF122_22625 [Burkholderia pseudomallei]|nr:hypothetical protein BOC52_29725 [Burkholderia pseudomallei]ARL66926.1 hypothetical protein BOC53_26805 [Burkholderia pseudomallei]RSK61668.1 hypothetical protein DF122_22625 [Burkholderia pseudomallei]